jgi:hypothetical protein
MRSKKKKEEYAPQYHLCSPITPIRDYDWCTSLMPQKTVQSNRDDGQN